MLASEKCRKMIEGFEGLRLTAYKCSSGIWTIGYGHTNGVKEGDIITKEKASQYLAADLSLFEFYVNKINDDYCYGFNQNQFDALVSFTFNCGQKNLYTLVKYGGRNIEQIAEAMLLYNKSNGKVLNGLVKRRQAEYELFVSSTKHDIVDESKKIARITVRPIPTYRVRQSPSLNGKIIGSADGLAFEPFEICGDWIKCKNPDKKRFYGAEYVYIHKDAFERVKFYD